MLSLSTLFLKMLNMSLTASWLIVAIIVLRPFLKKTPKFITVLLWGLVGLRLLLPFPIESMFSLVPNSEPIPQDIAYSNTPEINIGYASIDSVINPVITETFTPDPTASVNPLQVVTAVAALVWVIGVMAMLLYSLISYLYLRHKVRISLLYRDNIYFCDNIDTPFILGVFLPKIYLPSGLSEKDIDYVVNHEKIHLARKDHLWKPLGFTLLAVYWFNPLIWVAYILLCRDIEFACDEAVIKKYDATDKKGYSEALVTCSIHRRSILACPLAFGEVGVKGRIKSVLNYKKPAFWIILVGVIVSIVLTVCFMTTRADSYTSVSASNKLSEELSEAVERAVNTRDSLDYGLRFSAYEIIGSKSKGDTTTVYMWLYSIEYYVVTCVPQLPEAGKSYILTAITLKKTERGYETLDFWQPRDGSFYNDDIKANVPLLLRPKLNKSQDYVEKLENKCRKKFENYWHNGKSDTNDPYRSLMLTWPEYFTLSTDNGLAVYVWMIKENEYRCGISADKKRGYLDPALQDLRPTTVDQMKTILKYYNMPTREVTIYPLIKNDSSYLYAIDNKYCRNIQHLFYEQAPIDAPTSLPSGLYDEWGLLLFNISLTDNTFILDFKKNPTKTNKNHIVTYGPEYDLNVVYNGKIITFGEYMRDVLKREYEDRVFSWDAVLYTLPDNGSYTFNVDLNSFCSDFPAGKYIVSKPVTIETEDGTRWKKTYYCTIDYSPTQRVIEPNIDFSTLNLSSADNILVLKGNDAKIFNMSDEIVSKIKRLKGNSPISSFGYSGATYAIYIRRGEQVLYQFTILPNDRESGWIFYGNYDNVYKCIYTSDLFVYHLDEYLDSFFND